MLSLAVYIDYIESSTATAERPGLMFRPPEFPGVLVQRDIPAPLEAGASMDFARGKSCLLPWPDASGTVAVEMFLIDVLDGESRGVLLGAAVHTLRLNTKGGHQAAHVPLCDIVGNTVATLHARCRVQHLGAALVPHLAHDAEIVRRAPKPPRAAPRGAPHEPSPPAPPSPAPQPPAPPVVPPPAPPTLLAASASTDGAAASPPSSEAPPPAAGRAPAPPPATSSCPAKSRSGPAGRCPARGSSASRPETP